MASVFLSYDHDDAVRATPIASALENAGHLVWWDRHIKGGAEYNDVIEAAVEKADAVVELSVRSAWVRDEAAEGRDQGKLVPVLIDAIKPPMGFRQFQTIDLSGSKRGPGNASLQQLLDTIDTLGEASRASRPAAAAKPSLSQTGQRAGLVAAALAVVAIAAVLVWSWRSQPALAVIAVAASDSAPRSQALSRDLVVKLGTLAQVGASKWQLADLQSSRSTADLVFRVAETGSVAQPQASLVLLDGRRNNVLWSREFAKGDRTDADLRLQLSLTAGRVLGCALEARETGGLPPDLFKLFLAGCSEAVEVSNNDPEKIARTMRAIVEEQPRFTPAWGRLLLADGNAAALADIRGSGVANARGTLTQDIRKARRIAPDLPEIKLAEIELLPPHDYAGVFDRLAQAKALTPDKADIWLFETIPLQRVGRMSDAIVSARRAAELDPLSPAATTQLITTLAYGGRIELAKQELQRAERQWTGTEALRDAQWAFHLRYGDPKIAMTLRPIVANAYWRARLDPTPENVDAAVADLHRLLPTDEFGGVMQAFGEFHRTEEAFAWLDRVPPTVLARHFYVLFRPGLADVRRDPRFMVVANRIGLLSYWRESGAPLDLGALF